MRLQLDLAKTDAGLFADNQLFYFWSVCITAEGKPCVTLQIITVHPTPLLAQACASANTLEELLPALDTIIATHDSRASAASTGTPSTSTPATASTAASTAASTVPDASHSEAASVVATPRPCMAMAHFYRAMGVCPPGSKPAPWPELADVATSQPPSHSGHDSADTSGNRRPPGGQQKTPQTATCAACERELKRDRYSKNQWRKGPGMMLCKECVTPVHGAKATGARQQSSTPNDIHSSSQGLR